MPIPITFPDWMPWWLQLLMVVIAILLGLSFLFMPFSVFGVKSRLEAVEARLDEIQGEIRSLALRLPEPGRGVGYEDEPVLRASAPVQAQRTAPPIPPASWDSDGRAAPRNAGSRVGTPRAEPRLGRPTH
jgi:hypothetical protein